MFGGTVGGPIVKNKLFFFFDYQGSASTTPPRPFRLSVFTTAERAGDFGDICPEGFATDRVICHQPGQPSCYDPLNGNAAIPNNVIAACSRSIRWRRLCSRRPCIPLRTVRVRRTTPATLKHRLSTANQYDIKVDFNATNNDHIFGRFSHCQATQPDGQFVCLAGHRLLGRAD